MLPVKNGLVDIRLQQRHGVLEVLLHTVIVQGHALELIGVDADLAGIPAAQDQIPVHVEEVMGNTLPDHGDQPLLGGDEDIHRGQILGACGVVDHNIVDFLIFVQSHGQVQNLLIVGNAGLDYHGDILAALDVLGQHPFQVDIGDHGRVYQEYILVFLAVFQEGHGVVQRFQLAPVAVGLGGGVGGDVLQTALAQLQAPLLAVADVVHQGLVVEPGDHGHVVYTGPAQVGQAEVHLAVTAAKGNGGNGPLGGQLSDVGVIGEDNTHCVHSVTPPYIMSPGRSTAFSSTTAPLEVTLISISSPGA